MSEKDTEELIEELEEEYDRLQEQANQVLCLLNGLKLGSIDPDDIDVDRVIR